MLFCFILFDDYFLRSAYSIGPSIDDLGDTTTPDKDFGKDNRLVVVSEAEPFEALLRCSPTIIFWTISGAAFIAMRAFSLVVLCMICGTIL